MTESLFDFERSIVKNEIDYDETLKVLTKIIGDFQKESNPIFLNYLEVIEKKAKLKGVFDKRIAIALTIGLIESIVSNSARLCAGIPNLINMKKDEASEMDFFNKITSVFSSEYSNFRKIILTDKGFENGK